MFSIAIFVANKAVFAGDHLISMGITWIFQYKQIYRMASFCLRFRLFRARGFLYFFLVIPCGLQI